MAKQKGILKVEGKLGDLSFYKLNGKYVVRRKGGGFTREAIKHGANMARTRDNGKEFGHCSAVNKAFRVTLRPLYEGHTFKYFHSRLMKLFTSLKDLDTDSSRGSRKVYVGAVTEEGQELLKTYSYTPRCEPLTVLPFTMRYDADMHMLLIKNVNGDLIQFAKGADCVGLTLAGLHFDFVTTLGSLHLSEPVYLNADTAQQDVSLCIENVAEEFEMVFLGIRFYEVVDGKRSLLKRDNAVGFGVV